MTSFRLGRPMLAALLSAAALGWSAQALAAQPVTVQHAQGELVLEAVPQRVLVQDVAVLDILDALGVKVTGVPGDSHRLPDYLRQYASDDYIKTGTLQEPDYETIAAADADLMIVAGRSRAKLGELAAILPTIDLSVDNRNLVEGVKHNITTLGDIFGKQARAAELNAAIDAKFAQLREAAQHNDSTAIVLVTNAGKLGVYGTNSRVSWIFTEAGFRPVDTDVDDRFHGGDAVSFEYLLEADPDWLFVIDRDAGIGKGGAAQQLLDNALMHQTKAWKQQHIVYLDPMDAYTVMHGYRSIMRLADQVLAALAAAN